MNTSYTEYAVVVDDGPSAGFVLGIRRNRDQTERLRDAFQQRWDEDLVVKRRTVAVTNWTRVRARKEKNEREDE